MDFKIPDASAGAVIFQLCALWCTVRGLLGWGGGQWQTPYSSLVGQIDDVEWFGYFLKIVFYMLYGKLGIPYSFTLRNVYA